MNRTSSTTPTAERLRGKVAIITGGASGFGEATARLFVKHGAKVIIADVQDEKGVSLCKDIASSIDGCDDSSIFYAHCNVTDDNDVKNVVDLAVSKYEKLDIMFNNAGISGDLDTTILDTTNENFKKVFEVNVYGPVLAAKYAARVMIPRKSGVILFTASVASVIICGGSSHTYTMSKHAIVGLMKNLCVEMGQYGIRVNAISPSAVSTPILTGAMGMDSETLDRSITESAVLKGATLGATDVAHAALFLASDEAKFVSGLNMVVDGGYGVTNPSFSFAFKKMFS